jgi:glutaminyl-peptide cyclotransferase
MSHSILDLASVISNRISTASVTKALVRSALVAAVLFARPTPEALAQTPTVRPEIIAAHPHDRQAFTQGLLVHEGKLYESTGLLARSTLRRVVLATGLVEKSVSLANDVFAEGLALAGDRLFQLTWQNHVAFTYDLDFNPVGRFDYAGEGWGLCYDGSRLIMSDGSSRLFFRNPTTFAVLGEVEVRNANGPIANLNELECVGSLVYANVWQTEMILRIDPASGDVLHTIDASGLLSRDEAAGTDVLNGIAYDPATTHFFITGKLWPKLFEVRFAFDPGSNVPAGGSSGAGTAATGGSSSGSGGSSGAGESGGSGESETPTLKPPRSRSACGCSLPGENGESPWLAGTAWLVGLSAFARRRRPRDSRRRPLR